MGPSLALTAALLKRISGLQGGSNWCWMPTSFLDLSYDSKLIAYSDCVRAAAPIREVETFVVGLPRESQIDDIIPNTPA